MDRTRGDDAARLRGSRGAPGPGKRQQLLAGVLLASLTGVLPARADDRPSPVPEEKRELVAAEIRELFEQQRRVSTYPLPPLEEDAMADLLQGKIVRFREKWSLPSGVDENGEEEVRERHRVLAFYLLPSPRDVVWIAAMDPHFLGNDRLSEARLESDGMRSLWYQLMDPPWPVKNRHWVIRVEKPQKISIATDDRVWEQVWGLADDGERIALEVTAEGRVPEVPLERALKSRYLEENVGAWTVFRLEDDLTLLAYQLTIVMGGWVPDRLTARFAMGALEQLMKAVEDNTKKVQSHYDPEHEPVWGGNGRPVPFFSELPRETERASDSPERSHDADSTD